MQPIHRNRPEPPAAGPAWRQITPHIWMLSHGKNSSFVLCTPQGAVLLGKPVPAAQEALVSGLEALGEKLKLWLLPVASAGPEDVGPLHCRTGCLLYLPEGAQAPAGVGADGYYSSAQPLSFGGTQIRCCVIPGPSPWAAAFRLADGDGGEEHQIGIYTPPVWEGAYSPDSWSAYIDTCLALSLEDVDIALSCDGDNPPRPEWGEALYTPQPCRWLIRLMSDRGRAMVRKIQLTK